MNEMTITEMQSMQRALQEKYIDKWGGLSPAIAREKLLWMMIEAGEMADVIKKQGDQAIMTDPEAHRHFIEEACDVLMYLGDVLLCFDIRAGDIAEAYSAKFEKNMNRW